MMNFEIAENKGERIWGCSTHAIGRFIEKNRFLNKDDDFHLAIRTMLKMMNKAVYVTYDKEQKSHVYCYGAWVFCTRESTIITVYPKKGCKYERLI